MNNKITFPRLATLLADESGRSKRFSEDFLREFFSLISERLEAGESVKIKGLGTFRLSRVEPRKSVDVTTGEPMEISGHSKVVFVPAKEMAEAVNAPFEAFSAIEISDNVDIEQLFAKDEMRIPDDEDEPAKVHIDFNNTDESEKDTEIHYSIGYTDKEAEETLPAETDTFNSPGNDVDFEVRDSIEISADNDIPEKGVTFDFDIKETAEYNDETEAEKYAMTDFGINSTTNDEDDLKTDSDAYTETENKHSETDTEIDPDPEEAEAIATDAESYTEAEEETIGTAAESYTEAEEEAIGTAAESYTEAEEEATETVAESDTEAETEDEEEEFAVINRKRSWVKTLFICLGAAVCALFVTFAIWYFFATNKNNTIFNNQTTAASQNANPEQGFVVGKKYGDTISADQAEQEAATDSSETSDTAVETETEVPTAPSDAIVYDTISTTRYLTTMAKAHYGNYNLWPYIYEENKSKLGHPDRIRPGTPVVIPKLSKYGVDPNKSADIEHAKKLGVEIYARYGKKI